MSAANLGKLKTFVSSIKWLDQTTRTDMLEKINAKIPVSTSSSSGGTSGTSGTTQTKPLVTSSNSSTPAVIDLSDESNPSTGNTGTPKVVENPEDEKLAKEGDKLQMRFLENNKVINKIRLAHKETQDENKQYIESLEQEQKETARAGYGVVKSACSEPILGCSCCEC
jgi:hypothetical protein